jgi:hypothetical protein
VELPALSCRSWSVDEPDPKLDRQCFIVRDANGQALAYVYYEQEPGRRAAAKLLTGDEARRSLKAQSRAAQFGLYLIVAGTVLHVIGTIPLTRSK